MKRLRRGAFCSKRVISMSAIGSRDALVLGLQFFLRLYVVRVMRDAIHGADLDALGGLVMTHALGAQIGVDLVNLVALVDRPIRALGLTHIAVDAFVCNHQGHLGYSKNIG
jgi:hypothetical protein